MKLNIAHITLLCLTLLTGCSDSSDSAPAATSPGNVNSANSSSPAVPPGKTLVVIGQAVEPPVTASMQDYVENLGTTPAGFMFYLILSGDLERTQQELATFEEFMSRYPGTVLQLGLGYGPDLAGNLKESLLLLGGQFDAELNALGEWIKSQDYAVFLRPLYEFDRAGGTYGPADIFKPAYRYIVDLLRTYELTNTSFVWHSSGAFFRSMDESGLFGLISVTGLDPLTEFQGTSSNNDLVPIADYYPGEGYVDYFAISYWGDGNLFTGRSSAAFRAVYETQTRRILTEAQDLGLPLMISESTPAYIGSFSGEESVAWLDGYFALIEEFDIRMTSLIVANWSAEGGNWGNTNGFFPDDARIHPYPDFAARWMAETAKPRYVDRDDVSDLNAYLGIKPEPSSLPWAAEPEPTRDTLRWPACPPPLLPGTGGWCLPLLPGL